MLNERIPVQNLRKPRMKLITFSKAKSHHQRSCRYSREKCRNRHAGYSLMQQVNTDIVPDQVNSVHQDGCIHRHICFFHRTENRRSAVVEPKERKRECRDPEIGFRTLHDIGLYAPIQCLQNRRVENDAYRSDQNRNQNRQREQLAGRFIGGFPVTKAQILGNDHGTASSDGAKHLNGQIVDLIDNGNTGHGRLSRTGNHDHVHHSDQ